MTAIAAWVGTPDRTGLVFEVLARMPGRGDRPRVEPVDGVGALGTAVFDWHASWTGDALGQCGAVHVAADATLYYADELDATLRGQGNPPRSRFPADLIAAAVRRWGEDAPHHLEGDFAYVAFDRDRQRIFAARDWCGLRSLYFAPGDDGIALGSEALALALAPGVDRSLNLPWICEAASGRFEAVAESAFMGVSLLPAGHTLAFETPTRKLPHPRRFFVPPTFLGDTHPAVPFEAARHELRRLLEAAVQSRLPASEDVVVGLSGGRDSTAVYALARKFAGERVKSVSVSYPKQDPGWEDDVILDVLRMSGGSPAWIRSDEIGVLGSIDDTARATHEPFGHVFAEFQAALASGTRRLGARVMLNGSGGDQFFSGEPTYLADLLARGRLLRLAGEWRALGEVRDWKALFKLAVWPNLGPLGRAALRAVRRGRDLPDPFDVPLAPWVSPDPALRAILSERHRANFPRRADATGAADFERRWLLLHPFYPRAFAEAFRLYLRGGVELRTPLADLRVMRFAATRPRWERRQGWDMKLLLRACLSDLLPGSVTGPRRRPTGTTEGLLSSAVRAELPGQLARLEREGSVLDTLGLVQGGVLSSHLRRVMAGGEPSFLLFAVYTILAEAWLRAHPELLRVGREG